MFSRTVACSAALVVLLVAPLVPSTTVAQAPPVAAVRDRTAVKVPGRNFDPVVKPVREPVPGPVVGQESLPAEGLTPLPDYEREPGPWPEHLGVARSFKAHPTGELRVHIEPPEAASGAAWSVITGRWLGSGEAHGDLAERVYSVEFQPLDLWVSPEAISVYVAAGQTTDVAVSYRPLADFAVGAIPPQTAWHGTPLRFVVHAETSGGAISVEPWDIPADADAAFSFEPALGLFEYAPDEADRETFSLLFRATSGEEQIVPITPMAHLPPEQSSFEYRRELPEPAGRDYVLEQVRVNRGDTVNYAPPAPDGQETTRSIAIAAPTLLIEENSPHNDLYEKYNDNEDIRDLAIYAEEVIIRSPFYLPQTNIAIHARELRFEDPPGKPMGWACLDTTPRALPQKPAELSGTGQEGLRAGDITLHIESLYSGACEWRGYVVRDGVSPQGMGVLKSCARLIAQGGTGQPAGDGKDGAEAAPVPYREYDGKAVVYYKRRNGSYAWGDGTTPHNGASATPAGKPGSGGAAGDLRSSLDVEAVVDLRGGLAGDRGRTHTGAPGGQPSPYYYVVRVYTGGGGSAGLVYDKWHGPFYTQGGADAPAPEADVPVGPAGAFSLIDPEPWLTQPAMEAILLHLRESYIAGHLDHVAAQCEKFLAIIDALELEFSGNEVRDMAQAKQELEALRSRATQNLDYFGNPVGWVPMLSFEANSVAFENEIQEAIPILYLTYWLSHAARNATNSVDAMRRARDMIRSELPEKTGEYNEALEKIGSLEVDLESLASQIDMHALKILNREIELQEQAQENLEVPFWKQGLRILGSVLKVVPVVQPALGSVGAGFGLLSNLDPDAPLESIFALKDPFGGFDAKAFKKQAEGFQEKLAEIRTSDRSDLKRSWDALKATADQFAPAAKEIAEVLKNSKVPRSEIDAELERLKAQDPAFQDLVEESQRLNDSKQELAESLAAVTQQVTQLALEIQESILALDSIHENLASTLDKLNPRALSYIKRMERRTKDRLLKYQYFVAKAYEYRMLEPYDGELNLNRLFENFKDLVLDVDSSHAFPWDQFEALKGVYLEELQRVTALVLEERNANAPERSAPVVFGLSPNELSQLNEEGQVTINLVEKGIFGQTEENLRIVDFQTDDISVRSVGGSYGSTAILRLKLEHSGMSRISSRGDTFLFRHYRREEVSPISWKTIYDGISGTVEETVPSAASESLINHLLGGNTGAEDILYYSRPAAWADIVISKEVTTDNHVDMQMDALRLQVVYDYMEKGESLVDLQVEVPGTPMPNVLVGVADVAGRQDGRGDFRRVFHKNQVVTLRAQPIYGRLEFERWAGENGEDLGPLARSPEVELQLSGHASVRALYRDSVGDGPSDPADPASFVRGDVSHDGSVNLTDAVRILDFLFLGGAEPTCLDAADADDNAQVALTDAVCLLNHLFLGASPPPAPYPGCGLDPTADNLSCEAPQVCEAP